MATHAAAPGGAIVHAVIVAYNSAETIGGCVAPLTGLDWVEVTVVDNASPDASLAAVAGQPIDAVRSEYNGGFAAGCNLGIARGQAPYVLLLNPDARLAVTDLLALRRTLDEAPDVAIVAPLIREDDGSVATSQFRFPRLRTTFAQALFLHRLWPHAAWTDEMIRDPSCYSAPGSPDWLSGACMLVRRSALNEIGPLDEGFFMYCEDTDLCARLRGAGWQIRFEPSASVRHAGGGSGSRDCLLSVHAPARIRYVHKHHGRALALTEAAGVALGHATHVVANVRSPAPRRGHLRALRAALAAGARLLYRQRS